MGLGERWWLGVVMVVGVVVMGVSGDSERGWLVVVVEVSGVSGSSGGDGNGRQCL